VGFLYSFSRIKIIMQVLKFMYLLLTKSDTLTTGQVEETNENRTDDKLEPSTPNACEQDGVPQSLANEVQTVACVIVLVCLFVCLSMNLLDIFCERLLLSMSAL